MANKEINARIQLRYDSSSNWSTSNPVLLRGELGIESDTRLIRIGDGSTNWNNLSYINDFGQSNDAGVTAVSTDTTSIAALKASGVPIYISAE